MTRHGRTGTDPEREARIRYEQTRLLFRAMPISVWGTLLGSTVIVTVLWTVVDHIALLGWLAIIALVTTGRGLHTFLFFKASPSPDEAGKWAHQFWLGTMAAGATWGGAGIWLFPAEPAYQMMLSFVLAAACAVAVLSLSPQRIPIIGFLTLSLMPLAARLLTSDTGVGLRMGIIIPIFYLLMVASALRLYRATRESICLHLDSLTREEVLRQSQQRLALHVQRTPLAVIDWNTQFEVTSWNPAAENIFGYTREEAIGKHAAELVVPPAAREQVDHIWQELLVNQGGLHSINENITKDGRAILCEWNNTPLVDEDGKVIGIASLTQDITERMRVEKLKNEFISIVSHELRTPLTSIRGSLGLLLGGALGELPEKVREILDIANNNTQRLLLIINDILDIEKIESGKLEYNIQPTEIMPLIDKAITANAGYAHQYGVHFVVTHRADHARVYADGDRIMQVLNNLMSNAAKYSSEGVAVELGVEAVGERVRVCVTDYGPGIREEDQSKIFDKFTQLDASDRRARGGTGLGLSIARGIIEDHNGSIGFESQENQGATFYFELPASKH